MTLPTDPHARRVLLQRAARLAGLHEHPSFEELLAEIDRKEARVMRSLSARMMSPEGTNQRDIDYWRGFIQGLRAMSAVPAAAAVTLTRLQEEEASNREEVESGSE